MQRSRMREATYILGSSSTEKDSSEQYRNDTADARRQWEASSASASQTTAPTHFGGGWDDVISDSEGMPEDKESNEFLKNIKQIKGKTIQEIVALIPAHASGQVTRYSVPGSDWLGFQFAWRDPQGRQWRVHVHASDDNNRITYETSTSNTRKYWIVRVQKDNAYMDSLGHFHSSKKANPGEYGNEEIINNTHIPIETPNPYRNPVEHPSSDTAWGKEQLRRMEDQ